MSLTHRHTVSFLLTYAWILWTETLISHQKDDGTWYEFSHFWHVSSATDKASECRATRDAAATSLLKFLNDNHEPDVSPSIKRNADGTASVVTISPKENTSTRYVCLPDTLDPRGEKEAPIPPLRGVPPK